ncbi:carbon-nitrogen hydrolase family protein [Pseudomonas fragi]|uniref:carbon-nitrogen hydrolase family protein n=1 Tax=Pseudomonas fragi TaxID=296 RepID=UPI001F2B420F|nr:carbon-nitrogen hydrolase family protein [Pseudomonas fragi]MCF6761828.1 carbon-nitrogen hydrolase family protein [Pseudomonas fragi]
MKIELVQLPGRDGDIAYNLSRTLNAIATCAGDTDLLVFPETHLSGFVGGAQLAQVAEPLHGATLQTVLQAVRQREVAVVVGFAEVHQGRFYNSSVLVTPEGIALQYRKTHLWPSERSDFSPGDRFTTVLWRGVRVGLLICYDIELPETSRALAQLGAELVIVSNGNMDPYGPVHRTAIMARAQENQLFAVMVNRVGAGDDDLVFAGGSMAVDPFGRVLFEAGRDEVRHVVELDLDQLKAARRDYDYLKDRRLMLSGEQIEHSDGRRELLIGASQ